MTPAEFKEAMPEFESADDTRIEYWCGQFSKSFDESKFGENLDRATATWVAFNFAKELRRTAATAAAGGASAGLVVEKKVGAVSVKYSEAGAEAAAKDRYLENDYGKEFAEYAEMAGMGAVAV